MFESIFTSTAQDTISIGPAMLGLLTALVLGLLIGIAYMIACKKDGYNKNFIIGLVLLPAIVSVVILLIGSNVARAFSMAGAHLHWFASEVHRVMQKISPSYFSPWQQDLPADSDMLHLQPYLQL